MTKIEVDDETLDAILNHQGERGIRSRGKALASLVELGSALACAERGGFDLAPILQQQLVRDLIALDDRLKRTDTPQHPHTARWWPPQPRTARMAPGEP
jgi:hypothetical protein